MWLILTHSFCNSFSGEHSRTRLWRQLAELTFNKNNSSSVSGYLLAAASCLVRHSALRHFSTPSPLLFRRAIFDSRDAEDVWGNLITGMESNQTMWHQQPKLPALKNIARTIYKNTTKCIERLNSSAVCASPGTSSRWKEKALAWCFVLELYGMGLVVCNCMRSAQQAYYAADNRWKRVP